jgi:predicted secreted protein
MANMNTFVLLVWLVIGIILPVEMRTKQELGER